MNAAQVETPKFLLPMAITKEQSSQLRMVSHAHAMVAAALKDSDKEYNWPPLVAEALNALTPKQRQFAIRVGAGQPHFQAYRNSYDVSEERSDISLYPDIGNLTRHPKISTAISLLQNWMDKKWLLDAVEVKDFTAAKFYEEAMNGDTSAARIKATEALARLHGLMVDKREVTHRDATEHDEQAALFRSIIDDLKLAPVLEAEYVLSPQQLEVPTLGTLCLACNLRAKLDGPFEDGAGI